MGQKTLPKQARSDTETRLREAVDFWERFIDDYERTHGCPAPLRAFEALRFVEKRLQDCLRHGCG